VPLLIAFATSVHLAEGQ